MISSPTTGGQPLRLAPQDTVSLRLGHISALTVHRTVIHYRNAASLPYTGEAWRRGATRNGAPRTSPPTEGDDGGVAAGVG